MKGMPHRSCNPLQVLRTPLCPKSVDFPPVLLPRLLLSEINQFIEQNENYASNQCKVDIEGKDKESGAKVAKVAVMLKTKLS